MEILHIQDHAVKDGEVEVQGYKHAMVQIVAASIALNTPALITNIPLVDDSFVLQEIITKSGGICTIEGHKLFIDPREMKESTIDSELSEKIHGSLYLMPAFAIKFGLFSFGESGGCQIGNLENQGKRPVNHMLDVMNRFGIETNYDDGLIIGKRKNHTRSIVVDIMDYSETRHQSTTPKISGATKTAFLCAIGTQSCTILHPYLKTDVQDLLRFLHQKGYQITSSRDTIKIQATSPNPICKGIEFQLTECISEVMTYIALAVHTNINLTIKVKNIELIKKGLNYELNLLKKMNVQLTCTKDAILISKNSRIKSIDIDVTNDTIQSDHHPFFALMLLKGDQRARIREFVWKDRFAYVHELKKLGGDLIQEGNTLYISPSRLKKGNQTLIATDTRAAAILILASLTAATPVYIENVHHLHRGYENLLNSLKLLGVNLTQETKVLL